jgi:hypothetical protein
VAERQNAKISNNGRLESTAVTASKVTGSVFKMLRIQVVSCESQKRPYTNPQRTAINNKSSEEFSISTR